MKDDSKSTGKGAINRGNKAGASVLNKRSFSIVCTLTEFLWVHCTYKIIKHINS